MQSNELSTRWAMAVNPNTPAKILAEIAVDSPSAVLERIAENPRANAETLRRLATEPFPSVRSAVAENLNAPEDVILMLSQDDCADVRYSIAENHNMSQEVLERLADDSNPYVAARAAKTLMRLQEHNLLYGKFQQHGQDSLDSLENMG